MWGNFWCLWETQVKQESYEPIDNFRSLWSNHERKKHDSNGLLRRFQRCRLSSHALPAFATRRESRINIDSQSSYPRQRPFTSY
jgi:hypothetical protein